MVEQKEPDTKLKQRMEAGSPGELGAGSRVCGGHFIWEGGVESQWLFL